MAHPHGFPRVQCLL